MFRSDSLGLQLATVAAGIGVALVARSCAAAGVAAISFGGGEPLEWPPLFEALAARDGAQART